MTIFWWGILIFTISRRVHKSHIPIYVYVSRLSQSNSVEDIVLIYDISELINRVYLHIPLDNLPLLQELVFKVVGAHVLHDDLGKIKLIVSSFHSDDHLTTLKPSGRSFVVIEDSMDWKPWHDSLYLGPC
jgi:hypothetical protein